MKRFYSPLVYRPLDRAVKRQKAIDRYQTGQTDPKGIWRAKKGRTTPHNPSCSIISPIISPIILEKLKSHLKKVLAFLLSFTLGACLYWLGDSFVFFRTPIVEGLFLFFLGSLSGCLLIVGAIGLVVTLVFDPLEWFFSTVIYKSNHYN